MFIILRVIKKFANTAMSIFDLLFCGADHNHVPQHACADVLDIYFLRV
jgi:hypothetical protein